MARQEHVLTVFVASPSDVESERTKLEEVIREWNFAWSREQGIRLDLVRWETHAYPSVGKDAQTVINDQIPEDFDVFIGIMWCRYGTPTGRAGSGTVEEFRRAKNRYDREPNSVHIMIYFKDEAVSPSKLDLEQLAQVKAFRNSLGEEGALYWSFNSTEQFSSLIRVHLTRRVQEWKTRHAMHANMPIKSIDASPIAPKAEEEEIGILELIEIYEDQFLNLVEITNRIADANEEVGKNITEVTAEMNILSRGSDGKAIQREARKLFAKAALAMNRFAASVEEETPLFREAMSAGMNALIKFASITAVIDTPKADIAKMISTIKSIRVTLQNSIDSTLFFRETIDNLPPISTDLNKAKRRASIALGSLQIEFRNGDALFAESELILSNILNE